MEGGGGEQAAAPAVRGRLCVCGGACVACVPCVRAAHAACGLALAVPLACSHWGAAAGIIRCEWVYIYLREIQARKAMASKAARNKPKAFSGLTVGATATAAAVSLALNCLFFIPKDTTNVPGSTDTCYCFLLHPRMLCSILQLLR